jgi:hypothetical protein
MMRPWEMAPVLAERVTSSATHSLAHFACTCSSGRSATSGSSWTASVAADVRDLANFTVHYTGMFGTAEYAACGVADYFV